MQPPLELKQELEVVQVNLEDSKRRALDALHRKESAEKDIQILHDCYTKASGFMTNMGVQNAELEKQSKIAKEEATKAMEAVKASHSGCIKALKDRLS
ncbi:hypothetical protein H0H92_005543, partial [Tricholoma furcatifolium]